MTAYELLIIDWSSYVCSSDPGDYMRVRNCGVCGQVVPGAVSFTTLSGYPGRYNTRSEVDQFARNKTHGFSLTIDHDADAFKLRSISAYRKLRGPILFDTDGSPETVANIYYAAQQRKNGVAGKRVEVGE